jgi:hypothetical protein
VDTRRAVWVGTAIAGVVLIVGGIVWLFVALGSEEADRISSGIGAGGTLVGLILTVMGLMKARAQASPRSGQQDVPAPMNPAGAPTSSGQTVQNSTIMGPNVQIGGSVTGGITAHGAGLTDPPNDGKSAQ